jgi:hypothetical protein
LNATETPDWLSCPAVGRSCGTVDVGEVHGQRAAGDHACDLARAFPVGAGNNVTSRS